MNEIADSLDDGKLYKLAEITKRFRDDSVKYPLHQVHWLLKRAAKNGKLSIVVIKKGKRIRWYICNNRTFDELRRKYRLLPFGYAWLIE